MNGIGGQATVILEPLKSLEGTAHLTVSNVFAHVPMTQPWLFRVKAEMWAVQ